MVFGILAALTFPRILPVFFPDIPQDIILLYFFPLMLVISLAGCIIATLLTKPTEEETLKKFYLSVRPWGFWKPIHDKLVAEDPSIEKNRHFKRDMFNVLIGTICQTALVALPIFVIVKAQASLLITIGIIAIAGIIMKRTWYDNLEKSV